MPFFLPEFEPRDHPGVAPPSASARVVGPGGEGVAHGGGVEALLIAPIPVTPALGNLSPDLAGGTHRENIHSSGSLPSELLALFRKTGKPIAISVDSGRLYDDFVQVLQRGGIPVWRKIDRASRALSALATL